MVATTKLPTPPHFDESRAGEVWLVPYLELAAQAEAWAREHDIQPSASDTFRINLMVVDCQITFCTPGAELFVAGRSGSGAVEDTARTCRFIYEHLGLITEISPTMDTHTALQIFHPVFWVDADGNHPEPHSEITAADVEAGRWKPNPRLAPALAGGDVAALERHAKHYARSLSESGKYPLVVWPYHGMLGGINHALQPSIEAACFFHSIARSWPTRYQVKGSNPLTESYSVLGPEVRTTADGKPLDGKNTELLERLLSFDAVVIAGQAKSHCLAWTVGDLLDDIAAHDERLARKVYLLEDCTSAVVVPGAVDFSEQADAAFERFARGGMHIVRSTTPIERWPGIDIPS